VLSVPHFVYRAPSYDDLRWQFNTSLASGAQGILWFFYYMREPHGNYRLAPIDENWDRTPAWHDLRRLHQDFHRRYGDLFLRLVSTRVAFYPKAFAGGTVFAPDDLVSDLTIDNKEYVDEAGVRHNAMDPKHPLLLGEFADLTAELSAEALGANPRLVLPIAATVEDNRSAVTARRSFPGADTCHRR
jgi:hypothetical protein